MNAWACASLQALGPPRSAQRLVDSSRFASFFVSRLRHSLPSIKPPALFGPKCVSDKIPRMVGEWNRHAYI